MTNNEILQIAEANIGLRPVIWAAAEIALRIRMREVDGYASALELVKSQPRVLYEDQAKEIIRVSFADADVPPTSQGIGVAWTKLRKVAQESEFKQEVAIESTKRVGWVTGIDMHAFLRFGLDNDVNLAYFGNRTVGTQLANHLVSIIEQDAQKAALVLVQRDGNESLRSEGYDHQPAHDIPEVA